MAQFLISTRDRGNGVRRGDIVSVRDDGLPWGARENIGEGFAIYRQPNLSMSDFWLHEPNVELAMVPYLDETALPAGLIDAAEAAGGLDGTAEGLPIFLGALRWR